MAKEPGELTEPELGGDLQKLLDGYMGWFRPSDRHLSL